MGWFDDDDDDDDEAEQERQKKKQMSLEAITTTTTTTTKNSNSNSMEEEDEDPLDAYMKSLESSAKTEAEATATKPQPQRSERLDVENEEEATSHWKVPSSSSKLEEDDELEASASASSSLSKANAAEALQSAFHKAGGKAEDRQVNIQLDQVEHAAMGYTDFVKSFWSPSDTSQGHNWRRENAIRCHPPVDPIWDFAELRDVLPKEILEWISQQGITKPTLVQSQTLPVALSGMDAIVTASTGSGKTLTYLWPLVTHLLENKDASSRALILVPTRELALQVEQVSKSLLSKIPNLRVQAITGGNLGRYQLSQALWKRPPKLIVATPGRLLDVLSAQQKSKKSWLLQEITFLVLDEADKMLQMGFANQVTQVLQNLRPDRQSLLTSATLHSKLEGYCHEWMHQPTRISIGRTGRSSEHVQQHVLCLPTVEAKQAFLKEMLPTFCQVGRTLVFCATREGCESLATLLAPTLLANHNIPLQTLHGDKHPSDRKAALKAFASGKVKLLIATDVAGRGLDIPEVATVLNYDPAKNWDTHVHRIGRAGRLSAGMEEQQEGTAYTLLLPSNADFCRTLVQAYEREERPIAPELRALAGRSKQQKNFQKASQKNGLGYAATTNTTEADEPPAKKKSRWS